MCRRTQWHEAMVSVFQRGCNVAIEMPPGETLTGLTKKSILGKFMHQRPNHESGRNLRSARIYAVRPIYFVDFAQTFFLQLPEPRYSAHAVCCA